MKEICSGGVIYYKEKDKKLFLLIKSSKTGWWVFPKGHVEENEDLKSAALREIEEEVGISKLKINDKYHEIIRFVNHKGNEKEVHHWLFEAYENKVRLSKEHMGYKWLDLEEAYNLIDHDNQKRLLKIASELIKDD